MQLELVLAKWFFYCSQLEGCAGQRSSAEQGGDWLGFFHMIWHPQMSLSTASGFQEREFHKNKLQWVQGFPMSACTTPVNVPQTGTQCLREDLYRGMNPQKHVPFWGHCHNLPLLINFFFFPGRQALGGGQGAKIVKKVRAGHQSPYMSVYRYIHDWMHTLSILGNMQDPSVPPPPTPKILCLEILDYST